MSVQSAANTARLRRITGFNPTNPNTTIITWFRTNALGTFRIIWDHGSLVLPLLITLDDASPANLLIFNGDFDTPIVGTGLTANTWYFTATVLSTLLPVRLYWGAAGGPLAVTESDLPFIGFPGTELILYNELLFDETLNGQLAAFKVYSGVNGALSQAEIENEFQRITPARTLGLYGFWPLLNATAPGIDESGNANNLTVNGTLTTERTMPPILYSGRFLNAPAG